MPEKLIVLMIDGVSADHYQQDSGRFPHLQSIEERGFRVQNLHSEVLGTSLPGRTSMLTGVTADVSGVYANKIWGGDAFRYANPDDIRVPTIPARAKAAGKTVANIGMGMIRPEDTDIFKAPWWSGAFIQRARDPEPEPSDAAWIRVATHQTDERFKQACAAVGVPSDLPQLPVETEAQRTFVGLVADQMILDWVGILATSDYAPDLITAEFLMTDTIQHYAGYRSAMSQWSVTQADMAVGNVLARLQAAGQLDEWNIAVMSDHGHSEIKMALHPDVIIPGAIVQCEGSVMMVAPRSDDERAEITEKLAAYDVHEYSQDCLPHDHREHVMLFLAPDHVTFEADKPNGTEPTGKPTAISSHGLKPGLSGDDRFALFAGPDVPQGSSATADAVQIAPTFAKLLGLELDDFPADPVF